MSSVVSGFCRIALFRRSEEVMGHAPFSKPVFLKFHPSGSFQARSALQAYEYLDLHWDAPRTATYRQAKSLCRSAIDGLVDVELARQALIDAAERAGVLASKWKVGGQFTSTSDVSIPARSDLVQADAGGFEEDVTDGDMVGYYRARDIVEDPSLSPSRKKALLAYWASDVNAVAGAPGLRSIRGVTVTIDSLFEAMEAIDSEIDQAAMVGNGSTNVQVR